MESKINDTNGLIYKKETHRKQTHCCHRGRNSYRLWEGHIHSAIFKMDNQQKPILLHMELCSVLYASLDEREVWRRMDTCICMAESLHSSPEIIKILLIGYTAIQNDFSVKK